MKIMYKDIKALRKLMMIPAARKAMRTAWASDDNDLLKLADATLKHSVNKRGNELWRA